MQRPGLRRTILVVARAAANLTVSCDRATGAVAERRRTDHAAGAAAWPGLAAEGRVTRRNCAARQAVHGLRRGGTEDSPAHVGVRAAAECGGGGVRDLRAPGWTRGVPGGAARRLRRSGRPLHRR